MVLPFSLQVSIVQQTEIGYRQKMMGKIFVQGLFALAPLVITVGLLGWLYDRIESFLKPLIVWALGSDFYFPGLGLLIALSIIFLFGLFVNYWLSKKIYDFFENLIKKIPLIKTLYNSLQDLFDFFRKKDDKDTQVVEVEIGEFRLIGLVTQQQLDAPYGSQEEVAVYFPMSYQIGGYTLFLKKEKLKPINLSIEEAMNYILTAGALKKNEPHGKLKA